MRTIIDLTPGQLEGLDRFRKRWGISRAAAVRQAVDQLIDEDRRQSLRHSFGQLTHEEAQHMRAIVAELRSEWDRE